MRGGGGRAPGAGAGPAAAAAAQAPARRFLMPMAEAEFAITTALEVGLSLICMVGWAAFGDVFCQEWEGVVRPGVGLVVDRLVLGSTWLSLKSRFRSCSHCSSDQRLQVQACE